MPRQLQPAEMVAFQQDTNYLDAGIPVFGSRVAIWTQNNNMPVLIYHTKDYGYVLTDISDLGQSVIDQLAKQSEVHGMWYYLTQSTQEVIAERAEQVVQTAEAVGGATADILQAVAATVGKTLHDLIAPLVDALMIPLVIIGAIAAIYLIKKG
jgi:hypothetical protein